MNELLTLLALVAGLLLAAGIVEGVAYLRAKRTQTNWTNEGNVR